MDGNVCQSEGWFTTSRLYLNNYWVDSHKMLSRRSSCRKDESKLLWWSTGFSSSTAMRLTFVFFLWNVSTTIGYIAMTFGTDTHIHFRVHYYHFGDSLDFDLVPSSGQTFNLNNTVVYDQIPAKLKTISLRSTLCLVILANVRMLRR